MNIYITTISIMEIGRKCHVDGSNIRVADSAPRTNSTSGFFFR